MTFRAKATDSAQYDKGEVIWTEEGGEGHFTRRLLRESLEQVLEGLKPKRALDIGCGQGWLCKLMVERGVEEVCGIDPSVNNVAQATVDVLQASIELFSLDGVVNSSRHVGRFDLVTAVMVLEHLPDIEEGFRQLRKLMAPAGMLLVIFGDFDKMVRSRHSAEVQVEGDPTTGEVATRSDFGSRAGVIHDIVRRREVVEAAAEKAGLQRWYYAQIQTPRWVVDEQPQYKEGDVYFHLLALVE